MSAQINDDNSSNTSNSSKILGVFYGIGMNVNSIIGSGIVTSPGIVWKAVKSPVIVLLLWFIGGIVSMAGSLTYVELGATHKVSGGETKYLKTAYPNPKLMISYIFSFMFIFAIRPGMLCAVLQSAAQYFWYTIEGYDDEEGISQKDGWYLPFSPFWSIKLLAVSLLFIITVYHMLSNKWANYINQTLAVIKLITYSIIALAGIHRLITNQSSRDNWKKPLIGNPNIAAYSTSILSIMFSYDGWNTLNYSLDEFRRPEKKLIFSNSISTGIVTIVYLLVNIAFISVVPENTILNDEADEETIAAIFFRQLFGGSEVVVRIFTFLVVLSVIGTAASLIWSGSRVIVVAAESNFIPKYSSELKTWDKRFETPVNALISQFIWCSLIILFVGSSFIVRSFTLFSTFSMYSYWIFYFATGIGLFLIRKRKKSDDEFGEYINEKHFKVPFLVAVVYILSGAFILIFSFFVDVTCPENANLEECLKKERIQQMSPIFISYGSLLIALVFWYFSNYGWNTEKMKRND